MPAPDIFTYVNVGGFGNKRAIQVAISDDVAEVGELENCYSLMIGGEQVLVFVPFANVADFGSLSDGYVYDTANNKRCFIDLVAGNIADYGENTDCWVILNNNKRALLLVDINDAGFIADYGNADDCFVTLTNGKRAMFFTQLN